MDMNWKKLMQVSAVFPKIKELVLCQNSCFDFENINFKDANETFPQLEVLNLDSNQIQTEDKVELLSNFKKLKELKMRLNQVKRLKGMSDFSNLMYLNIEENQVDNSKIISDISRAPALESIRFLNNPIVKKEGERHIRNRLCAEISTL